MKYENGFYIYTPNIDDSITSPLNLPQVIEIIEGEIWLTGMDQTFSISYASRIGVIGKMVMSQDGEIK